MKTTCIASTLIAVGLLLSASAQADENLFGYVRGAEVIPKGGWEIYNITTLRDDKGAGSFRAWDNEIEVEYGVSDRFNFSASLSGLSVDTHGLLIDGYLPQEVDTGLRASGVEIAGKYNFLRPAADGMGLSGRAALEYEWLDKHSGQDKQSVTADFELIAQKYFMDGQMVWVANLGLEATWDDRDFIPGLPPGFDWPQDPEMEIEVKLGTGLSYRFAPNWFVGAEALYETEFETEVSQERWSVFAGPSLHYGSSKWWATLTYMPQIRGGGEQYAGQSDTDLHLIEKTKQETRLKIGFNF
jgi:hypothetical protein